MIKFVFKCYKLQIKLKPLTEEYVVSIHLIIKMKLGRFAIIKIGLNLEFKHLLP